MNNIGTINNTSPFDKISEFKGGYTASQPKIDFKEEPDRIEFSKKEEETKKKGFLEKTANFVGSVKKAFVTVAEYAKGTIKGIGSFATAGTATVGTIYGTHKLVQGAKIAKEAGKNKLTTGVANLFKGISKNLNPETLKKTLKTPKGIGTVLAGVVIGGLTFTYQIYKAKLAANEKRADLDHKYFNEPHK